MQGLFAPQGRVLALDVGDVRIGVAVSDGTRTIAQPLCVYKRVGYGPDSAYFVRLAAEQGAALLVLGLPLNMDATCGFQAEKVKAFGEVLQKAGLTVAYQDERMTTQSAERALLEGDMRRADRRQTVDKIAAAVILQQWLDTQAAR